MAEVWKSVRASLDQARKDVARRKQLHEEARALRFAWALGVDTLYKFRSLAGPNREAHTFDVIENSRIYFSRPEQFNDPFDCAPPFALAKSASDPEFVKELEEDERRMSAEAGLTQAQLAELRQKKASRTGYGCCSARKYPSAVARRYTDILRLRGIMPSIAMVPLCGQPQRSLPALCLRLRDADWIS